MPKASGPFDSFDNLDKIDINSVLYWLKTPPAPAKLEDYLANKILYPSAFSLSIDDMKIDLAILREALRMNGPKPGQKMGPLLGDNPFLNFTLRKIIIPQNFLRFYPDLVSLTWAFVDGLLLNRKKEDWFGDLWIVVVSDDIDEVVGTVLLPQFMNLQASLEFNLLGNTYKVRVGSLTVLPCPKERCELSYKVSGGQILGKNESALEVYGGRLGLMIDGRV
ncbi:hypothetical protein A3C26_01975 [Candidatus Daviesbacteria bacterium RIFCSPHIGHO2_02_FULL_39_12]|uniref:Uncharacterized protein n=1 Tax=Candidatus Daviesbacteria bacterium RIFCSPHIGHO2_02_FULL_39_12 TaxID=1797770 RepID=A0A1F5J8Y2_9BACT|nr:MAG: hypothetical protein A3C26_01975 [Candidatus Daviesbacteria bacterium RIFCSPHIGHO2_02_FULL_39_12]